VDTYEIRDNKFRSSATFRHMFAKIQIAKFYFHLNSIPGGIYYYSRGSAIGQKRPTIAWRIGGVARSVKMLSGKQSYLMNSCKKENFIAKIPEANKILKILFEANMILNFTLF
jgi:hypothetical protein